MHDPKRGWEPPINSTSSRALALASPRKLTRFGRKCYQYLPTLSTNAQTDTMSNCNSSNGRQETSFNDEESVRFIRTTLDSSFILSHSELRARQVHCLMLNCYTNALLKDFVSRGEHCLLVTKRQHNRKRQERRTITGGPRTRK